MSGDCHQCQNVVFRPVPDGGALTLQAQVHHDVASLERCVKKRTCHLCIVLLGMLENRRRFGPEGRQSVDVAGRYTDISLWLYYEEDGGEEADDWVVLDDESDGTVDGPKFVVFTHPLGSDDLRIQNPAVVSRSAAHADAQEGQAMASQTGLTLPEPSLGRERHDMSTSSESSMVLAKKWIETCSATHGSCAKRSAGTFNMPTRLLEVSNAEDKSNGVVMLVESRSLVGVSGDAAPLQYATLSHRWNPSYNYSTVTSNLEKHVTQGMHISLLPKTLAEACITARRLGLQYIWIDSLCIIQDSTADKAVEIPRMADYYQDAEVNLAASTESLGGLWSDRDGVATRPFSVTVTVELPEKTKQVVLELAPLLRANKSYLDYRGWILQERIFPRRTLFFDAYWLSFECSEMSASESCPQGLQLDASSNRITVEDHLCTQLKRDCTLSIIGGTVKSIDPSSPVTNPDLRRQIMMLWYRILNEYSIRQLSFESDRLEAISGLASRLSQILGDTYIGGIWRSSIIECLQWRPDDPYRGSETIRQTSYRAPTWSWASCELLPRSSFRDARRVLPLQISNEYTYNGAASMAVVDILDVSYQCQGANLFGDLAAACLTLSGRPLRGLAYSAKGPDMDLDLDTLSEEIEEMPAQQSRRENGTPWGSRTLIWLHISGRNREGQRARMIMMVSPDTSDQVVEGDVYLLPLAERWLPAHGDSLFCLVLKEVRPGMYERIGHSVTRSSFVIKVAARQMTLV